MPLNPPNKSIKNTVFQNQQTVRLVKKYALGPMPDSFTAMSKNGGLILFLHSVDARSHRRTLAGRVCDSTAAGDSVTFQDLSNRKYQGNERRRFYYLGFEASCRRLIRLRMLVVVSRHAHKHILYVLGIYYFIIHSRIHRYSVFSLVRHSGIVNG